jgi:hypothetical protein
MADKKTQMEKIREAYVKAQADKGEDRVTQADIERMQNFMKNKDKIKFPPKKIKNQNTFTKQIGETQEFL